MSNIKELPSHLQGEPWARLPKPGRPGEPGGRFNGLSRTTLLELSEAGLIKTAVIKKPGALKGIRLVYLPSLYAYLEGLATQ
jgi:hypothetical protein